MLDSAIVLVFVSLSWWLHIAGRGSFRDEGWAGVVWLWLSANSLVVATVALGWLGAPLWIYLLGWLPAVITLGAPRVGIRFVKRIARLVRTSG